MLAVIEKNEHDGRGDSRPSVHKLKAVPPRYEVNWSGPFFCITEGYGQGFNTLNEMNNRAN